MFLNKFLTTALIATVGFCTSSYSQQENCPCPLRESNQGQSLADAAKDAKKNKTAHAAKAITDEDMDSRKGPLPRLNMEGTENSDEIIQAISEFKAKHNERETEQALHDWYNEYDTMLATAIRETTSYRINVSQPRITDMKCASRAAHTSNACNVGRPRSVARVTTNRSCETTEW